MRYFYPFLLEKARSSPLKNHLRLHFAASAFESEASYMTGQFSRQYLRLAVCKWMSQNLDVSKAGGPDGIPARLLKECSHQIAPSLCSLFNDSLRSGHIPSEWKSADVTPVHKKNSKNEAANYRPISLLPIISKTLERCIYWRFYNHVEHFISPSQHGFLRNRSCVTQLLSSFHSVGHDLDTNTQTDILYLEKSVRLC